MKKILIGLTIIGLFCGISLSSIGQNMTLDNFSIGGVRNLVFGNIITETKDIEQVVQELSAYPNPCGDVLNISQNTTTETFNTVLIQKYILKECCIFAHFF